MSAGWSIALHGGAGPIAGRDYAREEAFLGETLRLASALLTRGASALDTAQWAVTQLEASGLYLAGRGAQANLDGAFELDAAIMHGPTRKAGAVAALQGIESPIEAARLVMDRTPNVLLCGDGARALMVRAGLARVTDPAAYYTPAPERTAQAHAPLMGTVGAVICDVRGHLAAATSTAGITGKTPGRAGDTPVIGAGTWADDRVAVSCTGVGEYFIRANAAATISARMRWAGETLAQAADAVLADVAALGGEGGLIAIAADGTIAMPNNSGGMKRALATSDGRFEIATF
jgi:L-asparaginase / beta-aspartyl-peptidase